MDSVYTKALELHKKHKGKIKVENRFPVNSQQDLALAYSPGVAAPCEAISKDPNKIYDYTMKGDTVAIISDGSAVLGLGNIGAEASLPVMEGKAMLLKKFADINAFPICIKSQDADTIIKIIQNISTSFGAINLEDIAAPKCITIEDKLIETLDIPVFHDDQHGTAIVVAAALINAAKVAKKNISDLKVAQSGTGAAGTAIIKILNKLGVKEIRAFNKEGVVNQNTFLKQDQYVQELLKNKYILNCNKANSLEDIVSEADVFIGVSVGNILTPEMVQTMNSNAIIFALANPVPEISFSLAKSAGALVVGTGRSDFPNQINNVLCFPGIFKGVLESGVKKITDDIKLAAAYGIANLISEAELTKDYIVPGVFDKRVVKAVSSAVYNESIK